MKQAIIRLIYTIAVFVLTVFLLESGMEQGGQGESTVMPEASFPLITMQAGSMNINELHGSARRTDTHGLRAPITPVGEDRDVPFMVSFGGAVEEIRFEVSSVDGSRLIQKEAVTDFERSDETITARASLNNLIEEDTEYLLTLIARTAQQEEIFYYTRILCTEDPTIAERIRFASRIHEMTYRKTDGEKWAQYLETDDSAAQYDLGHVTIHSSADQVTWGSLEPVEVVAPVVTVKDIQSSTALCRFDYKVSVDAGDEQQYLICTEEIQVQKGTERNYLLDYDRRASAVFDPEGEAYPDGQILLGIREPGQDYRESEDAGTAVFVQADSLFSGRSADRSVSYIFGFADADSTDRRELYRHHLIQILKVSESGDADFMVCGYMNRGRHEGETGICIYRFNSVYRTIEERAFIPFSLSDELLCSRIGNAASVSDGDELTLMIGTGLCRFDLKEKEVDTVVAGLGRENTVISGSGRMMAYSGDSGSGITLLDLSSMESVQTGAAGAVPLGFVREDLVYGVTGGSDVMTDALGNTYHPMHRIVITDPSGNVLTEYEREGYVIESCDFLADRVVLHRLVRNEDGSGFVPAEDDQILSTGETDSEGSRLERAQLGSQGMISLIRMKNFGSDVIRYIRPKEMIPESETVIDPPKASEDAPEEEAFLVYAPGQGVQEYRRPADAIRSAAQEHGIVTDQDGNYIWIYANKPAREQIMSIQALPQTEGSDLVRCLTAILELEDAASDVGRLIAGGRDAEGVLAQCLPDARVLDLSGCTLQDTLFYVSKGFPVIATYEDGAVLIVGYNENEVVIADAEHEEIYFAPRQEAETAFRLGGNKYLSYLR